MRKSTEKTNHLKIVFFDGVCVLCNSFTDIILKYDKKRTLKVASLQGVKAQMYLSNDDLRNLKTIIYYTETKTYYSTDAIIEISKNLSWPLSMGKWIKFIPRFIREALYFFIAKNRYTTFGKRDSCRLPTADEKDRFLD